MDKEVNSLPYKRFWQLAGLLAKSKREEVREKFIMGAWMGFQMGAAGDKNFGQYLEGLGLAEGQPEEAPGAPPVSTASAAKAAIAKAEEILAMARKKTEKPTVPYEQSNNDIVGGPA